MNEAQSTVIHHCSLVFTDTGAAHLPQDLTQDSYPYRYVARRQPHSQGHPANLTFVRVSRMMPGVLRLLQHLMQQHSQPLDLGGLPARANGWCDVDGSLPNQLVQAYRHGLAEVHE